ncbi:MAG: Maf family protein [Hyphomicrobium sp.]|nr:Maf family protein [Hyphomicrobium sp.]
MTAQRLILASGSAARRSMLSAAGLNFNAVPAAIDEDHLMQQLAGRASHPNIAVYLAEAKALDVSGRSGDALVIGSDQILSTGDDILSKPGSREGAVETLRKLRGRMHMLYSAVALAANEAVIWQTVDTAKLKMRSLSDNDIARYLDAAGEDIFGCVGAYQIEGLGAGLFETVEGDRHTIMGMPLVPLLKELRRREGPSS